MLSDFHEQTVYMRSERKEPMKKLMAMITVAVLMLCLLPAAALAAEGDFQIEGVWVGKELADGTAELIAYTGGTISGEITTPATIAGYAVTGINSSVFSNKTGLTSIIVSEGVTYLAPAAFGSDTALAEVSLPSTLKSIGANCFYGCDALQEIDLPSGLETIEEQAFWACSDLETVTMGGNVKTIGDNAFTACSSLSSITLADSITSIGADAFQGCMLLQSINIPASMTTIGDTVFHGSGLTSVDIPATVQTIGIGSFNGCPLLTSVTFHEGLQTIGMGAFYQTSITEVTIPSTVTMIGNVAFADCPYLIKATILNPAVTFEGTWSFGSSPMTDGMYGFAGSTAEPYSALYGFSFTPIYKLTFNSKGGSDVPWGYDVAGGSISQPADPTRSGYAFAGWYDNDEYIGTPVTFPYTITESYTLYADWTPVYRVTFDANGGSAVASQDIAEGGKVTEPADPTLAGNVFGGWYADEDLTDAWAFGTDTVSASITLHAKWTKLTLTSTDADGKIYTGGRVTLTPSVPGGVWTFDSAYFTREDSTFTALKTGTSTITYTVGGVSQSYEVTIEASELPSTGQNFDWAWLLCGMALVVTGAACLVLRRRAAKGR